MEWQVIVALVLATPLILLPVAFVWYMTLGGAYEAVKTVRRGRVMREVPEEVLR